MLEKELILGYAAYNLMRAIVAKAANKLSLLPRKISFSRACALVQIYANKIKSATSKKEYNKLMNEFYKGLSQSKIPNRKKMRIEPRKVARVKKLFPVMKKTREEEREIAKNKLLETGNRKQGTTLNRKKSKKLKTC